MWRGAEGRGNDKAGKNLILGTLFTGLRRPLIRYVGLGPTGNDWVLQASPAEDLLSCLLAVQCVLRNQTLKTVLLLIESSTVSRLAPTRIVGNHMYRDFDGGSLAARYEERERFERVRYQTFSRERNPLPTGSTA